MSENYDALEAGLATSPEKEIHLRLRAWWGDNDRVRGEPDKLPVDWPPTRWSANLERLRCLLSKDRTWQALRIVDALRELSRFREAASAVAQVPPDPWQPEDSERHRVFLQGLIERRDRVVREVPSKPLQGA